jgi:rRNA-processing protein FCF1
MDAFPFNIPKGPIIDTNVLFEFLVWRFFQEIPEGDGATAPANPFSFQYLRDSDTKKAFLWYFSLAKPIETSPHVIAEIHSLALRSKAHLAPPRLDAFWSFAQEELAQLKMEEHFVPLAEMDPSHLHMVGPTDTSLLQRAQQSGRTLLTEDGELRGRCSKQGIKVLGCWEVLARWQESRREQ